MHPDPPAGGVDEVVLGRVLAAPLVQGDGDGAAARSARAGLPHPALEHPHPGPAHGGAALAVGLIRQGDDELEVGARGGSRIVVGGVGVRQAREEGGLQLGLGGQGDDGVRVGHGHAQGRPLPLQAGDDHGRVPALGVEVGDGAVGADEPGRTHVHRPQLAGAGEGARPAAGADGDRLPVRDARQPLLVQDGGEEPGGVAAHLRHRPVGVVVVHEPLRLRDRLVEGLRPGQGGGAHHAHEAVGPDTGAAVAQGGDLGGAHIDLALGVDEQQEVVLRAVPLDEGAARQRSARGGVGRLGHGRKPRRGRRARGPLRPPEPCLPRHAGARRRRTALVGDSGVRGVTYESTDSLS